MTVGFELRTLLPLPIARAFDLARDIDAHLGSMKSSSERAVGGVTHGLISMGETVTWRAVHFGVPFYLESRISSMTPPTSFTDEQVRGPFKHFRHDHWFTEAQDHTLMLDEIEFSAPFGPLGVLAEKLILAKYMRYIIAKRNAFLVAAARSQL
ncbi:hypothetical protein FB562_2453 [Homoserinimonas aerilata]|uniref:Ligand-binding SRPBCC domain-containing protein n=1 Tax=Homoserinimonas aerilata TaxID=1162970 RepID=A0A542YAH6_9MICO|nr:SRPBCC family protein [Homoserinimonas aerilata]TQL45043.1 hypothetical protein FB562_2453 [Homoserinimonas aerilata]